MLTSAGYQDPHLDSRTERIDKVLLHPVWGTIVFFVVMFLFFQALFTWAAPAQDAIDNFFSWLGGWVDDNVSPTRSWPVCWETESSAVSAPC